jgi:type I restriction enzyme S subunit
VCKKATEKAREKRAWRRSKAEIMNVVRQNDLPEGWVLEKIGDICNLINGRAFKPSEWASKGLPIVRIQNLNNEDAEFNYCDSRVDDKYIINRGQLLFAWSGTPGTSFGAHIWKRGKAVLNQHIFKVEINESHVDKVYLMYLLNKNVDEYIRKAHGTAGLAHITKGKFENSFIPLAPLPVQKLIVAEIEKQFSRLDEAVTSLKRIKANLKRYKASVLKAAVEGKLTEEWRINNKDIEPADKLLERIKKERSLRGVERRSKLRGKEEIASPLARKDNLPELPKGWVWATTDQLFDFVTSGSRGWARYYSEDGAVFLRIGNLDHDTISIDLSEIQYVNPPLMLPF